MDKNVGLVDGEICNRNGCKGIIEIQRPEGSCSCHTNPPCSYCTDANYYCPECEWDHNEECLEKENKERKNSKTKVQEFVNNYWGKEITIDDLDKTKISYISKPHTHFTMKKIGVYPPGTTRDEIYEKIKGSFGGRFEQINNGTFTFIAYTD